MSVPPFSQTSNRQVLHLLQLLPALTVVQIRDLDDVHLTFHPIFLQYAMAKALLIGFGFQLPP